MMSDEKAIIVGDTKIHGSIFLASGNIDADSRDAQSRAAVVAIALEMIKSTCAGCGSSELQAAMDKLSVYADTIVEACEYVDTIKGLQARKKE